MSDRFRLKVMISGRFTGKQWIRMAVIKEESSQRGAAFYVSIFSPGEGRRDL